jgi:Dr1-associated corepressor
MPSNKFKTKFPPARIKKIMQTDEEVGKVAAAVPVIVSKSLELFTEIFLQKSGQIATDRGARTLSIEHIKECVDAEQKFDFLREIVKEAAAKAVGKTGEEASAGASLHPAPSQSESLPNGTKDTSLSTTKTDLNALRQQRKRMMKMEESPGTSSTFPTSSPAGSSSFLPSRNQPSVSSTSVITKVEKRPFPVKKEYSWLKTETNEADDEGEEEQFAARKKRSKCNSVVDGLVVPNQETRFSAKEKMKLHSPSMRVVEGVKYVTKFDKKIPKR